LQALADADAIADASTELLGRELGVARCHFTEYDLERSIGWNGAEFLSAANLPTTKGEHRLEPFSAIIQSFAAGKTLVKNGGLGGQLSEAERSFVSSSGARSQISVPLLKAGKLGATLTVIDVIPRQWRDADVALVAETALRTWAAVERARAEAALRDS